VKPVRDGERGDAV